MIRARGPWALALRPVFLMKNGKRKPKRNTVKTSENNEDKGFVPTMAALPEIVTDEAIQNASFIELQRRVAEEAKISPQWRGPQQTKEKLSVTRGISYLSRAEAALIRHCACPRAEPSDGAPGRGKGDGGAHRCFSIQNCYPGGMRLIAGRFCFSLALTCTRNPRRRRELPKKRIGQKTFSCKAFAFSILTIC